jgi:hypothetical protein
LGGARHALMVTKMLLMLITKCILGIECNGMGDGGLKRKWRLLMKRLDSTKLKYTHLFKAATIYTNVLHRHIMDFTFEVIGV